MHHLRRQSVQRKHADQRILQQRQQQPGQRNRTHHEHQAGTQALPHAVESFGPQVLREHRPHCTTERVNQSKGHWREPINGGLPRHCRHAKGGHAVGDKRRRHRSGQIGEHRRPGYYGQQARVSPKTPGIKARQQVVHPPRAVKPDAKQYRTGNNDHDGCTIEPQLEPEDE